MKPALRRRDVLLALGASPLALHSWAQDAPAAPGLGPEHAGLRRQALATMRVFGLQIYDVSLWSSERITASQWSQQRFTLSLVYARSFDGADIAERSIKEMRRQPGWEERWAGPWQQAMAASFPNVRAGDRLSGIYQAGEATRFLFNGQERPAVSDPAFGPRFFGIWLSPQTSEPRLRDALLSVPEPARG